MPKSSIALFLLVAPVIGLATPVWSTAVQTPSTVIAFDGARAYRHVVELAGDIGICASGSPQEEQAARYIAQQMTALGYPVVMQIFPIFYWEMRSSSLTVSLHTSGAVPRSIDHAIVWGSPLTPPQGLRAAVVHVGLGRPDDFRAKDVVGKVALMRRGDLFYGEKVVNAALLTDHGPLAGRRHQFDTRSGGSPLISRTEMGKGGAKWQKHSDVGILAWIVILSSVLGQSKKFCSRPLPMRKPSTT